MNERTCAKVSLAPGFVNPSATCCAEFTRLMSPGIAESRSLTMATSMAVLFSANLKPAETDLAASNNDVASVHAGVEPKT